HVEDHCAGIDVVLREGTPGEVYNIGGDQERTNVELARRTLALTGKGEELIQYVKDRLGHDRRYSVDSTKIKALGWSAEVGFEDGLARTVKWYRQNEGWWRKIKDGSYREYYRRMYENRRVEE
ncbi:MAG: GDP-mannose 4,6-dehydratase, partial [Actinobacteria bacterium]|nr:GDP-mannose 4,6-dehydratase [Actinomycetota bacterium]